MKALTKILAAVALLVTSFSAGETAAPAARPRLVLVVSVDGLSWNRLAAWKPYFRGGLKRLLEEGAVATECRSGHINTLTGPGHASLSTGAPPRVHGIPENEWYVLSGDGTAMAAVYCAEAPVPAGAPAGTTPVRSAARLRVPTLGDRLVASDPRAKVVSLSLKDRAAILLAGHDPHHSVYWYDENSGTFTTSAAYPGSPSAAAVVSAFNASKDGPRLAASYGTHVDRAPRHEGDLAPDFDPVSEQFQDPIVGRGFPKDLAHAKEPYASAISWTALGDRLLADLATSLLDDEALALGRDDVPDILAISFSANDFASHDYGPGSEEAFEVLSGLDADLGRLLADVERRFGKDAVGVALSADHGMLAIPDAAHRVRRDKLVASLNGAVDARLKLDPGSKPIRALDGCSLYLDRAVLARPGAPQAAKVLGVVKEELATTWKAAVDRTIDPARLKPRGDAVVERARNTVVPGESGELFVIPREGILIGGADGTGTSHGSPWDYDTHIPLIFWGGGIGSATITQAATPYDLAPTVASWIGVSLPAATGTRLGVRK